MAASTDDDALDRSDAIGSATESSPPGTPALTVAVLQPKNDNPYTDLRGDALAERGLAVDAIDYPLLFPLARTALATPDPAVLQLDWLYEFYHADGYTGHAAIDDLLTAGRALAFLVDLLLLQLTATPLVWTVHNETDHEGRYPRTERVLAEACFALADAVTAKCDAAADRLAGTYRFADADALRVVPDGSYVDAYENHVTRVEARAALSIPDDAFVYCFFGLIRPYKGVPELLSAYREVRTDDTECWIVGKPRTDALELDIRRRADDLDDVHAAFEYVPDERIQVYLTAADVLVLPYRDVLNSGAVHLGCTFGLPVVAPRIGCIPASLPPENDLLYDASDPGTPGNPGTSGDRDGLADALQRARTHPDLASVAAANLEAARERDWTDAARRLEATYRDVAA